LSFLEHPSGLYYNYIRFKLLINDFQAISNLLLIYVAT